MSFRFVSPSLVSLFVQVMKLLACFVIDCTNSDVLLLAPVFFIVFIYFQVSKKYVSKEVCTQIHEKVAPFIKWLKEAEEEESSEEEEEEEVEVVYDNKAQQLKAQVNNTAADEDDDDLDIDAI